MTLIQALFIFFFIIATSYITFVAGRVYSSCYQITENGVEQGVPCKVRRAASILIIEWAYTLVVFLFPVFYQFPEEYSFLCKGLIWHLVVIPTIVISFWSINAFLQFKSKPWAWLPWAIVPELLAFAYFLIRPDETSVYVFLVALAFIVLYGCSFFFRRYRRYARLVRAEYSDLNQLELTWVWGVFVAIIVQSALYLLITFTDSLLIGFIDIVVVVVGGTFIAQSAYHMRRLHAYLIEEESTNEYDEVQEVPEMIEVEPEPAPTTEAKEPEQAEEEAPKGDAAPIFNKTYEVIDYRLKTVCEDGKLFLGPELTREVLCDAIKINRTYLSEYLRSKGLTYYSYINKLRVEYAVQLMHDDPNLSLVDISLRCGYSTPSTFRRAFRDVMGCLPSEYVRE